MGVRVGLLSKPVISFLRFCSIFFIVNPYKHWMEHGFCFGWLTSEHLRPPSIPREMLGASGGAWILDETAIHLTTSHFRGKLSPIHIYG